MLGYNASVTNGAITLGGTSQVAVAAKRSRRFLEIRNNSAEDMWVNFGAAAAADTGIKIASGASWRSSDQAPPTNSVNVVAATTGSKFSVMTI